MKTSTLSLALALLIAATPAAAHRQWILPSATTVEGDQPYVTFDAAISEGLFDFDHLPIKLDGLVITGPDGQPIQPENSASGKHRSVFDLKLAKPGTYRASLVNTSVMASYMLGSEQKRWRGTESELPPAIPAGATDVRTTRMESRVETYVTAGEPTTKALAPIGKGLELVPLTNPTENVLGTPARLRALVDGKPVAGLDITIVPGGGRFRAAAGDISVKTDAAGEVTINWPMAGMIWVGANWPAREGNSEGPAKPDAPAPSPPRRLSYSATFEVAPF